MSQTNLKPPSDATSVSLLHSLRTNPDSVVWSQFVDRYEGLIKNWCRAWGLQEADRDDVTQDVLLSLSKAMREFRYDPSQSFRAWLKTVTRNAAGSFGKKSQRPGKGSGGSTIVKIMSSLEAQDDLSKRLEDEYDGELTELAILRVRMTVKPRTWQAFQLTAIDGRSGAEVAKELNMQVSHVYVAKSELMKALRLEIQRLAPANDRSNDVSKKRECRMPE